MKRGRFAARLVIAFSVALIFFAAGRVFGQKKPPAKPLDLNTATEAQLEQLPGIGPSTAQEIIRFREKSGPFRRVEDLLAIRGISKKRLEKLRPYVTVAERRRTLGYKG